MLATFVLMNADHLYIIMIRRRGGRITTGKELMKMDEGTSIPVKGMMINTEGTTLCVTLFMYFLGVRAPAQGKIA